ncbi:MAG: hypothetical protein BWK80_60960 [Desulfobacteraceae bacterium IS3]|nr:MAG: hypothetical protein BWK80_60960 [Desulfobacteraceae bacterium IS3]
MNTAFFKPQSYAKFSAKFRKAVQRYVLKLRGPFFGQSGIRPRNSRIYLCGTSRKTQHFAVRSERRISTA